MDELIRLSIDIHLFLEANAAPLMVLRDEFGKVTLYIITSS